MAELINQNTSAPTRKVNAGMAGNQLAALLLGLLAMFAPVYYGRIPDGFEASLGASLGGVLGYALAYFTRERLV